eukprot:TRINITY_DN1819_c0_g1_i2.p2 TRINITY_DN1819_c0_g1~~TRINITY_DN1819_c0_g1_i2.p2  ORF type:complete len:163 (+),score=49.79 TRINITY_DN1819_c0_g1_i2:572-1060(+)
MPEIKGKAVKILHHLGDELWRLGTELVQPASFQQPEASKEEAKADQAEDGRNESSDDPGDGLENNQDGEQAEDKKEMKDEKEGEKEDKKEDEKENEGKEEAKDEVDMDKAIYEAFMNALKLSVKDSHLPMEPSTLANSHMKCCTTHKIAFHLSSYKKVRFEE